MDSLRRDGLDFRLNRHVSNIYLTSLQGSWRSCRSNTTTLSKNDTAPVLRQKLDTLGPESVLWLGGTLIEPNLPGFLVQSWRSMHLSKA